MEKLKDIRLFWGVGGILRQRLYIAQAVHKLILLLLSPEYWHHSCATPHLANNTLNFNICGCLMNKWKQHPWLLHTYNAIVMLKRNLLKI